MNRKNSGQLVKTKDGKIGRTYNSKGLINGKIPVYLAISFERLPVKGGAFEDFPSEYSEKAILCDPKTLKPFGMID